MLKLSSNMTYTTVKDKTVGTWLSVEQITAHITWSFAC
jgi:hypothetical protein